MMTRGRRVFGGLFALLLIADQAAEPVGAQQQEPEEQPAPFAWQAGPSEGSLGAQATIVVPEGYLFLEQADTIRLLEYMENPTSGLELGTLAPESDDENWWLFFEFDDIGYVSDDEQDDLDADALLASIREGTEAGNEVRSERGWATLEILGWGAEPDYNPATNNLEWAVRGSSEGVENLNHDIRLLGRNGVMKVSLVASTAEYATALPVVRRLLEGFAFTSGNTYGEYRAGDPLADVGLAALITTGAAVALKTGLFKKFWKLIVVAVIAIGGILKKLLGKGAERARA